MEYRPLEITLLSADGIKEVNMFGKMDVYAVVFISGYPSSKKKTKVDKNCGSSPRWNQKLDFTIDERSISHPGTSLVIKLKAKKSLGNRNIGEVFVPLSELFKDGNNGGTNERLVDYQVRTSSGKVKGTVKFSYKLGDKILYNEPVTAYPGYKQGYESTSTAAPPPPAMAYPPHNPGNGYGYPLPPPPAAQGYYPPQPAGPVGGYPQPGYGYGYAQPLPPPAGYGYQQPMAAPPRKNRMGMGLGLGAGLLGGLLVGDMISDVGDMNAYNDGFGDAMGDMGGDFDF